MLAVGIAIIAAATVVVAFFTGRIKRNVASAVRLANAVAAGDLFMTVEVNSTDETAQLIDALNAMTANLRSTADIADQIARGNLMVAPTLLSEKDTLGMALKGMVERLRDAFDKVASYARELERSNKELDDFAYIASHDLKEPLRGINNHARFLMEDYGPTLDGEANRRLGRLMDLSRRIEKLVNDLLYFARIGRQELGIGPTDLRGVVDDVASSLEYFLEEKNAKLSIVDNLPVVTCDRVGATEILRNLIVNAAKYNDEPEKLVEVGFLATHPDASGTTRSQVLFVRDNGRGVPAEFHSEIFNMFKRLQRPDKDDGGTGAGLTFVRKIVERHGGCVWLDSEPGAGTTVFFTLAA
jgi:light-regulated signal transduction histidine kinase (bacteriophytochrome)/HAMP domain-containing protein